MLVAVELTERNLVSGTLTDDLLDATTPVDSSGDTYAGDTGLMYSVSQCQTFSGGEVTLGQGDSESGCVVFQIPSGVTPAKFQYRSQDGFGALAEWSIP
jgi:hypothetical protein